MKRLFSNSTRFRSVVFCVTLAGLLTPSLPAQAAGDDCRHFLQGLFKTRNHRAAEEILRQYEPFKTEGFTLTPLFEGRYDSVYQGTHPKRPSAAPFIIKVAPLHDAMNDYVALRSIRQAQKQATTRVRIIKGTLLPPRSGEIQLTTPVLQINEFVEGRPLIEILADPEVDLVRKTILKSRFRAWVDEIKPGLTQEGYDAFRHEAEEQFFQKHSKALRKDPEILATLPGMLMAEKPWLSTVNSSSALNRYLKRLTQGKIHELAGTFEDIQIILKPDNIIVNEADEFILFDPF